MDLGKNIFKDLEKGREFQERGFVKIPFLNQDELNQVRAYYQEVVAEVISSSPNHAGNLFTIDIVDANKRNEIYNRISELLNNAIERNFENYRKILGSFILKKKKHNDNVIQAHQDWTFVDEENFYSLVIWIPLVNTNLENGTLGLIPTSHKWPTTYSGTPSHKIQNPYAGMNEMLMKYFEYVNCNAGEAIMWNSRTLHGSLVNKSNNDRPVISISLTKANAEIYHYYRMPGINEYKLAKYELKGNMANELHIADASEKFEKNQMLFNNENYDLVRDREVEVSEENVKEWITKKGLKKNTYSDEFFKN